VSQNNKNLQLIASAAKQINVEPEELASVMALESGFRPAVWGGDKGQYFGLIQFGPGARKEVGLDPKIHNTLETQLPKVVDYFRKRGFDGSNYSDPAERQLRLYNTVLGGNPNANTNAKDAFGTSASGVLKRMLPGGDLRNRAVKFLGSQPSTNPATQTTPISPSEQTYTPFQFDIASGKVSLTPEDILNGAGIKKLNVPKSAPALKSTNLTESALQAALRKDSQPKPTNQFDEFLKGIGTGVPLTPYVAKPNPGGELAFGTGNLLGGVGSILGASLVGGGLPGAMVAGGGVFAKQAAIEGGSPAEVATRGVLGAATTALPFAMGSSALARTLTGMAVGGGTMAADEAVRRSFRGQKVDASVFTDPNTQYGAGIGAILGALLGGKGKIPHQELPGSPKLLPEGKITDPARLLPGNVEPKALPKPEPLALSGVQEPKLLPGGETKLLPGSAVKTTEGELPGTFTVQPEKPAIRLADDGGVMLEGGKTEALPQPQPKSRLSEAVIDMEQGSDGVFRPVPESFTNATLAKKYRQKLMMEKGYSLDEVAIQDKGGVHTVTIEPNSHPPELQTQIDQLRSNYQSRVSEIRQAVANLPNPSKAETVANQYIKKEFNNFQSERQQVINGASIEVPQEAVKTVAPISEQGNLKQDPSLVSPIENLPPPFPEAGVVKDTRPLPERKRGGVALPGEQGAFTSLADVHQYDEHGAFSQLNKQQLQNVGMVFNGIEGGKSVLFESVAKKTKASTTAGTDFKPAPMNLFPTHLTTSSQGRVIVHGRNLDGAPAQVIIKDPGDVDQIFGSKGAAQLLEPTPKQLGIEKGIGIAERSEKTLTNAQSNRMLRVADRIAEIAPRNRVANRIHKLIYEKASTTHDYMRAMDLVDQLPEKAKAIIREEFKDMC
jgi:hypothetical protein